MSDEKASALIGALNPQYQRDGISYLRARGYGPFLVFSDDREWAWQELRGKDVHLAEPVSNDLIDLASMSKAAGIVTANSSFSWWAAWMVSAADGPVVSPGRWFNDSRMVNMDLVPANWVRL